jgi:hypothetical protein
MRADELLQMNHDGSAVKDRGIEGHDLRRKMHIYLCVYGR